MTTPAAEDFAEIARRLREITGEKSPAIPIVTDPNPPDYVEPQDSGDIWYDPAYP